MFSYDTLVKLPVHVLGGSTLILLAGHPVVLCTDDQGVFQTSLSKEYAIAAWAFQLTEDDLWTLVLRSIDYTFLSKAAKAELTDLMQRTRDASSTPRQCWQCIEHPAFMGWSPLSCSCAQDFMEGQVILSRKRLCCIKTDAADEKLAYQPEQDCLTAISELMSCSTPSPSIFGCMGAYLA